MAKIYLSQREEMFRKFKRKNIIALVLLIFFILSTSTTLYYFNRVRALRNKAAEPSILSQPNSVNSIISDKPIQKSVFLLIFNPILENYGNQKLTTYKKWNDPDDLTSAIIANLSEVSNGYITYTIKERIEVDGIFPKRDGYQYSDQTYLDCINGTNPCHQPDIIDYEQLFSTYNICAKNVDEVWLWGGPYFGYWEYALAPYCGKTTFTMGFNYEVGLDHALHDFGHRFEHVGNFRVGDGTWYYGAENDNNEWNSFAKTLSACGNVHYPPGNPTSGGAYIYNNSNPTQSTCNGYLNYPVGPFIPESISCLNWGCNQEGFMKWWLNHIPNNPGTLTTSRKIIYNNWWKYFAFYDETSIPILTPTPSVSPTPTPTPTPIPLPTPDPANPPITLLDESFEHGMNNWSGSLLWHIEPANSPCALSYEGSASAYFGYEKSPGVCNYDIGAVNPAFLISPAVQLPLTGDMTVSFQSWHETENASNGDIKAIDIFDVSTGNWVELKQYMSDPQSQWVAHTELLNAYNGKTIQFRFRFQMNTVNNTTRGWYIDDVKVLAYPPAPTPTPTSIPTPTPTPTPSPTPSPTPVVCDPADINKDGQVNISDFSALLTDFFKTNPANPRSDIDQDGIVDITDYSIIIARFGIYTGPCQ